MAIIFKGKISPQKRKIMEKVASLFNQHFNISKTVFINIGNCTRSAWGNFSEERILRIHGRPESLFFQARILIQYDIPLAELRWTIAHELGHFYDWATGHSSSLSKEAFAENFAGNLFKSI